MSWLLSFWLVYVSAGDHVICGSYDCRLSWFDLDLSTKPYKMLRYVPVKLTPTPVAPALAPVKLTPTPVAPPSHPTCRPDPHTTGPAGVRNMCIYELITLCTTTLIIDRSKHWWWSCLLIIDFFLSLPADTIRRQWGAWPITEFIRSSLQRLTTDQWSSVTGQFTSNTHTHTHTNTL